MTAPPLPRTPSQRPHSPPNILPDLVDLEETPQVAPIALLQAALQVTAAVLDAYGPSVANALEAVTYEPRCSAVLLARLAAERCRELDDLLACYRTALNAPDPDDLDGPIF